MNNRFIAFAKHKWYFVIFLLMLCATYGSIRGAYKENNRTIWITTDDVKTQELIENGSKITDDVPAFIGYIGIANEQNEFYSFKLAIICMVLGIIPTLLTIYIYYKIYNTKVIICLRKFFTCKDYENMMIIQGTACGCSERSMGRTDD